MNRRRSDRQKPWSGTRHGDGGRHPEHVDGTPADVSAWTRPTFDPFSAGGADLNVLMSLNSGELRLRRERSGWTDDHGCDL